MSLKDGYFVIGEMLPDVFLQPYVSDQMYNTTVSLSTGNFLHSPKPNNSSHQIAYCCP